MTDLNSCQNVEKLPLTVPGKLSNGLSVDEFFVVNGEMNKKLNKKMGLLGLDLTKTITQKDYPSIISSMKEWFDEDLKKYSPAN